MSEAPNNVRIRILIIEDDPVREARLRSWIPLDITAVVASSAGGAIVILKRDKGAVYTGIVLDHDLGKRPATDTDLRLCGKDVVNAIIAGVSKTVPVLIHSVNESQAPIMQSMLQRAGFDVERIPMNVLTKASFNEWLSYARECNADATALNRLQSHGSRSS